jgi:hypothetical protein
MRSGRAATVLGLATLAIAAAGAGPVASQAANVEPCTAPRPLNPYPDTTRYVVAEGQPVPALLGENCLPIGDTVSSPAIDWGDGTSGTATVTYHPDSDGAYEQAWFDAPHAFARATCRTSRDCSAAYAIAVRAIDDATGGEIALRGLVTVTPAPSRLTPAAVRARSGRRFHGTVARIHTIGLRHAPELTARIAWGDGTHSPATITGRAHTFRVTAAHRWRHAGRYAVAVKVTDAFARAQTSATGTARVR